MHTFDYDDRDHHIHLHTEFTARVDSLSDDAFTDDDKRLKLLFAIYNWLVSHIAGIDRVMIAKMNGEYDDGFNSDTNHKQTRLVINNAYLSATQIAQISVQLKRARGRYRQSQLSRQIADATERLINLMSLADSRIEVTGCNAFQLRRLSEIRAAVASNANALAETAARRIIEYGASILSGKYGLPLGVGAIMERHLDRVSALVAAIGGTEAMSPSAKATTQEAITIANAVFAMEEASSTVLPELIARDQAI